MEEPNQVETKPENNQLKTQEQNKNLNESIITTTSTSSISINIKKNLPYKVYKAPKRKNFQIPIPATKQKPKNLNQINTNNTKTIVYTKGTIKKINNKNNNLKSNKSILNQTKLNLINDAINKDKEDIISNELNELNYFSNNESENCNKIKCNTIMNNNNHINIGNRNPYELSNMNPDIHKKLIKENKFASGYYSESDQRKEKNAVLNIEEILMIEEKLSSIISCIQNGVTCVEECFDWFNSYYHTTLSSNIEKYFIKDEYIKIIQKTVNLNVFTLMICYDISFNEEAFNECQDKLSEVLYCNHMILILISKYLLNKIIERNLWVNKLEQLIMKYDPTLKNALRIMKDIIFYCNNLICLLPEILTIYQNENLILIYNQLNILTSQQLYSIYREKIHRIINQNGSILASSSYFKNNKYSANIPIPYLKFPPNKKYTLVLDLDETLIHFKPNPNNEDSGTIKIRPYLYKFLDNIKKYYELIVFTAATQEYADPIIDAIEQNKKYFDFRLYRIHTIIIDNDFVKDLSKFGRDLSRILIVDNMEQNYKLQKDNGITIRPFWGKDNEDTALNDLLEILTKIAENNLDVRTGLKIFKEDIISKVTSNIFRRSQNRY